jgi:hypothetical protein
MARPAHTGQTSHNSILPVARLLFFHTPRQLAQNPVAWQSSRASPPKASRVRQQPAFFPATAACARMNIRMSTPNGNRPRKARQDRVPAQQAGLPRPRPRPLRPRVLPSTQGAEGAACAALVPALVPLTHEYSYELKLSVQFHCAGMKPVQVRLVTATTPQEQQRREHHCQHLSMGARHASSEHLPFLVRQHEPCTHTVHTKPSTCASP